MIDVSKDGYLWTVTLNRPEKANALTREMLQELTEIAQSATDARALILTGTGRVFSAGADLDAVKDGLAVDPVWERCSKAFADLPCLTIAALNGTLAGGAFGMALACDLRIALPDARFFYPVMKMGVAPQPSDPRRLAALVGPSRAKMLLVAGQKIDAETALRWGLIDNIAAQDALIRHARTLAESALDAPLARTQLIKNMIRS